MKITFRILKYSGLLLALFFLLPYLICPVYKKPCFEKFHGNNLFNPYNCPDDYHWYRVILHSHTNSWYGLTSGKNTPDSLYSKYRYFHFDVIGISDYMKINKYLSSKDFYIPGYEHGYGISKVHQLSVGAKNVVWMDFIYYFNSYQKQFMINSLKENCQLVSLNHPRYKNAYSPDDLKMLTNFDCFEAMNRSWFSFYLWDTLLSIGHYVPLIANDDCHDVSNVFDVSTNYTMVRARSTVQKDIISSLKKGASIGVDIYLNGNETFQKKQKKVLTLPLIKKLNTRDEIMTVITDTIVSEIKFIGQNGKTKKIVNNSDSASYSFEKNDTYIRTEITTKQNSKLILNPIFRYQDKNYTRDYKIDWVISIIYWFIILTLISAIVVYKVKKRNAGKGI